LLILEFEWSDEIEEHLGRHGVRKQDLDAMLSGRITFRRNKREGGGTHQIYGRGLGGRPLRVVARQTGVVGLWRPVTAQFIK
jgi:hypothetical protein